MLKKLLSLTLVLLMIIPFIVSCKKDNNDGNSDSAPNSGVENTESDTTSKYDVYDDIGSRDYGGRTVTVAQIGIDGYKQELFGEGRPTGEIINDALYKKNASVESRLNIKLNSLIFGASAYAIVSDMDTNLMSGACNYQIIHGPTYSNAIGINRGYYHDMNTIDSIDFDKEYWAKYVNDVMEIGGSQYMATGAISLSFYRHTFVTIVNDRLLAANTNGAPDLFKVVEDGDWTLEYQRKLAANYYTDQGIGGEKDNEDIFGFVANRTVGGDAYLASGDVRVLTKGQDGFYSYDLDLNRASDVLDEVAGLFGAGSTYLTPENDMEFADMFAGGHALMSTFRLQDIEYERVRDMADTYTILPIPKCFDTQDEYYTLVQDAFASVSIPTTVSNDDLDMVGAIVEVMCSESYRQVIPEYYEIVLKTRSTDHPENWAILDDIMESVKMDAIIPYGTALKTESTFILMWRAIIRKSYADGTAPEVASTFTHEYGEAVEMMLDGDGGLQDWIREHLSN